MYPFLKQIHKNVYQYEGDDAELDDLFESRLTIKCDTTKNNPCGSTRLTIESVNKIKDCFYINNRWSCSNTLNPTIKPTFSPSISPSISPTTSPPTSRPTGKPTIRPITVINPTISPITSDPTISPTTSYPSTSPTTAYPSISPTMFPTTSPVNTTMATPLKANITSFVPWIITGFVGILCIFTCCVFGIYICYVKTIKSRKKTIESEIQIPIEGFRNDSSGTGNISITDDNDSSDNDIFDGMQIDNQTASPNISPNFKRKRHESSTVNAAKNIPLPSSFIKYSANNKNKNINNNENDVDIEINIEPIEESKSIELMYDEDLKISPNTKGSDNPNIIHSNRSANNIIKAKNLLPYKPANSNSKSVSVSPNNNINDDILPSTFLKFKQSSQSLEISINNNNNNNNINSNNRRYGNKLVSPKPPVIPIDIILKKPNSKNRNKYGEESPAVSASASSNRMKREGLMSLKPIDPDKYLYNNNNNVLLSYNEYDSDNENDTTSKDIGSV